ncbi:AAA family ATPase [Cellulosimicrobium cellulans]|uniref:AAA family ATPase n=1 Tax=Cellulosimicrobium cellulans TaxID=1710 RepID=UPI003C56C4BF
MISSLRVTGFKCFAEQDLGFRQLNVLTGMNGAGKSTITQALSLIQSASGASADSWFELDPRFGSISGDAYELLNRDQASNCFSFAYTLDGVKHLLEFSIAESTTSTSVNRGVFVRRNTWSPNDAATRSDPLGPLEFIGAARMPPAHYYPIIATEPSNATVGIDGRYAVNLIDVRGRMSVADRRLVPNEDGVRTLRAQTEAWMSELLGPIQLQVETQQRFGLSVLELRRPGGDGEWTLPVNTGFGYSYILPVLVAGLLVPRGGTLIVDSPEAHLHPRAQSMIGRFLSIIASDGVQVFVETHSDHVLNGIRLHAVHPDGALSVDDVSVHYFDASGVSEIEIGERGEMRPLPNGFFDQGDRDLAALLKMRRRLASG